MPCEFMDIACMQEPTEGRRVAHPLTLEPQVVVRFYVGAEDWTLEFCKSSRSSEQLSQLHTQNSTFFKKSEWWYRFSHRNRSYLENSR